MGSTNADYLGFIDGVNRSRREILAVSTLLQALATCDDLGGGFDDGLWLLSGCLETASARLLAPGHGARGSD